MKLFFQRLISRKSRLYWSTMILISVAVLWGAFKIAFGYAPLFVKEVIHRVPYVNTNTEVILEVDAEAIQEKQGFRAGTPIYQFQPELTLVGFVSFVDKSDPKMCRFRLGIAKKYEISILRDDTRFELLHTSPSLLTILSNFLSQGKGEMLKEQMFDLANKNQKKITSIFSRLGEILGRELQDQQLAHQIINNPTLRKEVMDTLQAEIFSKIDWEGLTQKIEKDKDTARIAGVFSEHVNWKTVGHKALESGTEDALDDVSSYFIDPKYFSNMKGGKVVKLISGIISFAIDPEDGKKKLADGFQRGAWKGGWGVAQNELKRVFKEHNREILQHGSQVLKKAAEESQILEKVVGSFQTLAKNERLLGYVKARYGDRVADALVKSFSLAAHDRTILAHLEDIVNDIQALSTTWFEKLILNDKKTGPNPSLLVAFREGISKRPEPQIICFPGEGLRVNKEYIYQIKGRP